MPSNSCWAQLAFLGAMCPHHRSCLRAIPPANGCGSPRRCGHLQQTSSCSSSGWHQQEHDINKRKSIVYRYLRSLKLTANAPENRPKPNRKVVFQPSIFRGELLVSGRVFVFTFTHPTNLQICHLAVNQVAHVSDARNVEFPLVHVHTGQNVARGKEATFAHHQRLGQSHLKVQQLKATSTSTVFDPSVDVCKEFEKKNMQSSWDA